ncbi:hypothetical protein V5O48_003957 [Marasmius crinis-equi]|uniref:Uncharacterized protein n=1 Tax=Marasmius crinis-equi TaxID=585013 RepID=A0ABR3FRI7_9AGAR
MPQQLGGQEHPLQSRDPVEEEYQHWWSENKPSFNPATHDVVVHRFTRGGKKKIRWECKPKPEPSPEELAELQLQLQEEKKERRRFEIPLREPTLSERQELAAKAYEFCKKDRERLDRVKHMHESRTTEERERTHQEFERSMAILLEHSRRERLTPLEIRRGRATSSGPVNVEDFERTEQYIASTSSRKIM